MTSSAVLLARIRDGEALSRGERLWLIVLLSIPSILAQLTVTLMFIIDAAMVGQLGAEASAAIGLVETTLWLLSSIANSCTIGFGVQIAQSVGAKDFPRARRVLRSGIVTSVIFTLFLALLGVAIHRPLPVWLGGGDDIARNASAYFLITALSLPLFQLNGLFANALKNSGNMRTPAMLSMLSCALDVMFNFLCIYPTRVVHIGAMDVTVYGLGLGVIGAAIGSLLAIVLTLLLMANAAIVRSTILSFRNDIGRAVSWVVDKGILRRMLIIASPLALQHGLMNIAQMVSTMIIAPLGNCAIAANAFAVIAEALCYMCGFGVADAGTTLVGQSIGARRFDLSKRLAMSCVAMGVAVMTMMGVVMYIFAPEMMAVMTPVDEIIALGAQALRIEAFAEPLFAAAIVSSGCLIGAGDTFVPACMILCTMWGVRLTLAAWLAPILGLAGAWIAMAVELATRGLLLFSRLLSGRWLKKHTSPTP